jgi:hypothetical protein
MQDQSSDAARRAKIIERVRALLAMTTKNGCTEAEAMTAAAKAAELMEEYDLELRDVKSLEDERIPQQSRPFAADGRPREMHAAGIYVSLAIANFFDCKCWRSGTEVIFFVLRSRRRQQLSCRQPLGISQLRGPRIVCPMWSP